MLRNKGAREGEREKVKPVNTTVIVLTHTNTDTFFLDKKAPPLLPDRGTKMGFLIQGGFLSRNSPDSMGFYRPPLFLERGENLKILSWSQSERSKSGAWGGGKPKIAQYITLSVES